METLHKFSNGFTAQLQLRLFPTGYTKTVNDGKVNPLKSRKNHLDILGGVEKLKNEN